MTALFEINAGSVKRKTTGSRVWFNTIPLEFTDCNCFYENPQHGFKIGFTAIFGNETFALKSRQSGLVIQQPVTTSIILEEGVLKAAIQRKLPSEFPTHSVDALVLDLYELIKELLMNDFAGSYDLREAQLRINIWEVKPRKFGEALRNNLGVLLPTPALIEKLEAVQIC